MEYKLPAVGTRVRHYFARNPTGLGTVTGHRDGKMVVKRDDDGVEYTTHPINWREVEQP